MKTQSTPHQNRPLRAMEAYNQQVDQPNQHIEGSVKHDPYYIIAHLVDGVKHLADSVIQKIPSPLAHAAGKGRRRQDDPQGGGPRSDLGEPV